VLVVVSNSRLVFGTKASHPAVINEVHLAQLLSRFVASCAEHCAGECIGSRKHHIRFTRLTMLRSSSRTQRMLSPSFSLSGS
jgi:hypothetical protein